MHENVTDPMELLQEKAADAIEVLAALMHDETVSPSVRSSSALGLLEAAFHASELGSDQELGKPRGNRAAQDSPGRARGDPGGKSRPRATPRRKKHEGG